MDIPVFVDWLSMYQIHWDGGLPVLNDGNVVAFSEGGEIEWTTQRHIMAEGSFDSRLRVRCDGFKVEVSGNIGRFNRRDNLFGYGFEECVRRWNEFLVLWNLPPFTKGQPCFTYGNKRLEWSGAIVTRIDVTKNYACFSGQNLRLYMGWLATHAQGRRKVGVSPDGNTIVWGDGSRYVYEKFYNKAAELVSHAKKNRHITAEVIEFAEQLGVGRHELELKTRFLTQNGLRFLGEITMAKIISIYRDRSQLILTDKVPFDSFNDIPTPYRATAKDWRDGADLVSTMKRATYFRHRAFLRKQYGIDISTKCNVEHLPIKVRHIEPTALIAPDWYRKNYA
jgi:hypothetical protein